MIQLIDKFFNTAMVALFLGLLVTVMHIRRRDTGHTVGYHGLQSVAWLLALVAGVLYAAAKTISGSASAYETHYAQAMQTVKAELPGVGE